MSDKVFSRLGGTWCVWVQGWRGGLAMVPLLLACLMLGVVEKR